MPNRNRARKAQLLINVYLAGELSEQYLLKCPEGQTARQAQALFGEQWSQCVHTLQLEDPDDDWSIDDVVKQMEQRGWQMALFEALLDVEL